MAANFNFEEQRRNSAPIAGWFMVLGDSFNRCQFRQNNIAG